METPLPSSENARRRMEAQRSRDTSAEVLLRAELHRRGLRFRVHQRPVGDLYREADIVFRGSRVAVFVDGCFWHGCPSHGTTPKSNQKFWTSKLAANQARDRDTDRRLEAAGWTVVRVWEHEAPGEAANAIEQVVRLRSLR